MARASGGLRAAGRDRGPPESGHAKYTDAAAPPAAARRECSGRWRVAGGRPGPDNAGMAKALFRFDGEGAVAAWSAIDDGVMGGLSRSRLAFDPQGHALFEGVVSLANNGGFASVRSAPRDLGAAGATGYALEVRGDGRRYKLNLRTDDGFDGINYQAAFVPPAGTWTVVRLPLAAFRPTFRGRVVAGAAPLDPARVRQAGLMIADGAAGPFALAVRALDAD